MRPTRVEISQRNQPPVGVGHAHTPHKHLNAQLRLCVAVQRIGVVGFGTVVLLAVYCRSRTEQEMFTLMVFLHAFEQVERADEVVIEVENGVAD